MTRWLERALMHCVYRERTTKDENIISLVLHTFRNLAALKDRVSISDSADAIEQSGLQVSLYLRLTHSHTHPSFSPVITERVHPAARLRADL